MARYHCDICGSTLEVPGESAETVEDRCTYTKGSPPVVLRRIEEPRRSEAESAT